MQLIAELKRRKVFRVAAAYAVAAWALAQVADLVLENTAAPPWVMQVILLVLALGFPLAVLLAWAFEVTPEGVKRTGSLERGVRAPAMAAPDYLLVGLMIAVIVVAGVQFAQMADAGHAGAAVRDTPVPAEAGPMVEIPTAPDPAPAGGSADDRISIAVLAFENMSPDPDNAYFAEGISEEILNVLASIDALRVASRTSSFSLSGRETPIPEIAARLDVGHVLEGSVRKAGDRVRITAQLIDASNDAHLWSDVYDRELDDIFAVQEEIAQSISEALTGRLGLRAVSVEAPTDDLVAYELFLRGRRTFYQRGTTLDEAIADLSAAVERDPDFGDAWAVLAAAYYVAPGYPSNSGQEELLARAREANDRALALVPDHPLAVAVDGQLMSVTDANWVDGLARTGQAAALASNDSTPRLWYALDLLYAGYVHRAREAAYETWRTDPLVGINNGILATTLIATGDLEAARVYADLGAENGWEHALPLIAAEEFAAGRIEAAADLMTRYLAALDAEPEQVAGVARLMRDVASRAESTSMTAIRLPVGGFSTPEVTFYAATGQSDAFLTVIAETVRENALRHHPWLRSVWQPSQRAIRESPVFFDVAREIGLVELWETRGYPPGCRPVGGDEARRLDCSEFPG
ncbi:MAG: hypothetical protein R3323_04305 [Wenzhouxiangellaceae bacterium]|nr:hypothetical protein [Wenzhouxiangellaceae bacterium]